MKILVVSDTHGDCSRVIEVFQKLNKESPVDIIVHCGDYAADARELQARLGIHVAWVKGNCDGGFSDTDWSILETEAGNFIITHGHNEQVDFSKQNIYYKALENDCVGAIFGHTHRASYTEMDDIVLMNPGSLTKPRDGSGGTGSPSSTAFACSALHTSRIPLSRASSMHRSWSTWAPLLAMESIRS